MPVLTGSDVYVASPAFTGPTGEAADLTTGVPVCAVTRDDGTALAAAAVTADEASDGVYLAKLEDTVHVTRPDWLTLTWTGTTSVGAQVLTQRVEVAGGTYLTVPEVRGRGDALRDAVKFPAARIREQVAEFEDLAERYCGRSFVPRYHSEHLAGTGGTRLLVSKWPVLSVVSASYTDSAGTVTDYSTVGWSFGPVGEVFTRADVFPLAVDTNVTLRYVHGQSHPPAGLVKAARSYVRFHLLYDQSGVGRDVLSVVDPDTGGTTRYSTPDWDAGRPTGLLDVDSVLCGLGRTPVVA